MKKNILVPLASILSLLFFADCFMFPEINESTLKKENKGFAVVELFTSEGCSSCPPADELMATLQEETTGGNIFLLAFHVDYWNRLGWKDRFSAEEYTNRQVQYGQWLGLDILYTPQFVINGTAQFAGDSKSTLYKKVSDALKEQPVSEITLETKEDNDSLKVDYKMTRFIENTSLFLAVVAKKASTKVERGENRGAILNHVQIVTKTFTIPLKEKENSLKIPKLSNYNPREYELVGFVQNNTTGAIIAATRTNL